MKDTEPMSMKLGLYSHLDGLVDSVNLPALELCTGRRLGFGEGKREQRGPRLGDRTHQGLACWNPARS